MSDSDELEEIRRRKREELASRLDGEGDTDPSDGSRAGTPDEPVHVSGPDHLNELVAGHDVVLVDFYADWCGPCKMLEPIVADLARETGAAVAKVDVDANQGLAGQYGVRGVPTLVLFAGGEVAEQLVGVQDKDRLASLIERHGAS